MKLRNKIILALGGYTEEQYQAKKIKEQQAFDIGLQNMWNNIPFMDGVVPSDIRNAVKRGSYFGRNKFIFECPICGGKDRIAWKSTKLEPFVVGTELHCPCGHTWYTRMTQNDYNASYSEEEYKEYYGKAERDFCVEYATWKFGEKDMTEERLQEMINSGTLYKFFDESEYHPIYKNVYGKYEDYSQEELLEIILEAKNKREEII